MAEHQISWLVADKVILISVTRWNTPLELAETCNEVRDFVASSHETLVHTIWDFRQLEHYPQNVTSIASATKNLFTHSQLGWVITIVHSPTLRFFTHMGTSIYRVRHRNVQTYEEAVEHLKTVDSTLIHTEI